MAGKTKSESPVPESHEPQAIPAFVPDFDKRGGPLAGLKVIEIESIGPGPFTGMMLADMGANVLRIARPSRKSVVRNAVLARNRTATLVLDLKSPDDRQRLLRLIGRADALIEGFRPGVMERLGLGPEICQAKNPRLIYGRVTGWGRSGPLAYSAGHDINYIAATGALHACGTAESGPIPPLNLVGDFGGGGLMLAFGIACALTEAQRSGKGQVVDAAMTDGAASLMAMIYGLRAEGRWPAARAGNILDGSAYYYTCYECAGGGWMAVGAIEAEFRRLMLRLLGLENETPAIMAAADDDPAVRRQLAAAFRSRTRAEWQRVFEGTDACVSAVLGLDEVAESEQNRGSGTFSIVDQVIHPRPTPRFSRTPPRLPSSSGPDPDAAALAAWGLDAGEVDRSPGVRTN